MFPWCWNGSGGGMMGGPLSWMGWIFSLAILVVIVVGVALLVWLLLRQSLGSGGGKREKSSLDILKQRYAKGEIDKKQYEEMKKDLGG